MSRGMLAADEDLVTELPTSLDDLSFDDRLARLLPFAHEAAAWVTACEERWAREDFAPDAEPTEMRAAVARVLAYVERAGGEPDLDEPEALVQEIHDRLDPMVPERDPGADDPWETLYALDFRGAVGLAVLSWALTTLAGQGRGRRARVARAAPRRSAMERRPRVMRAPYSSIPASPALNRTTRGPTDPTMNGPSAPWSGCRSPTCRPRAPRVLDEAVTA